MRNDELGRRDFLRSTSALGLGVGLGSWSALAPITPANGAAMVVTPEEVRFRPEIEPVVRWIEDTPREKVFDVAVKQLKAGLSYRDLLAGLFLAGIRNIKPRPVGFKFHAVMVMNSAHLLGQSSAVDERLLPMFWALDNFKNSQAQDIKEGDWTLNKVDEAKLPSPTQAKAAFIKAMDAWDVEAADTAIAALCRTAGASETMEVLWRYAIRDQRNIGHKPIFVAQSRRTLQAIGWQHAEPVLRSVVYGILDLQGDTRPVPVGPYDANVKLAKSIREGWSVGKKDPGATRALLEVIRHADPEKASAEAAALLNRGVAPESLWDAVSLAGNEFLMQNPGIVAIHAVTSANSLQYIFGDAGNDDTRKLALLQAIGWMPLYRDRIKPKPEIKIDAFEGSPITAKGDDRLTEVLEATGKDRLSAARKAVEYAASGGSVDALFAASRRLIFLKGRDSHDYKYGAAVWEQAILAGDPSRQAALAAASLFQVPAYNAADNPLIQKARESVAGIMG